MEQCEIFIAISLRHHYTTSGILDTHCASTIAKFLAHKAHCTVIFVLWHMCNEVYTEESRVI